jgi:2-dehydro-3-deoxy-D-arabinonate dehydratase
MKLCRFSSPTDASPRVGLIEGETVVDLTALGVASLQSLLESPELRDQIVQRAGAGAARMALAEVRLRTPVEDQEVWAAGVTYLRSKQARMDESEFSASAYDRVYEAPRPELFFKSMPRKVVSPGDTVGIRRDARWNVPEPELALVLTAGAELVGYTIGNDMSSRDIEGENALYLPQAKVYDRSCAVGPCVVTGVSEAEVRAWTIGVRIQRAERLVFEGSTRLANIKRSFAELIDYLFRSQTFPDGVVLLTGTGVVPPDDFTLAEGDRVRIEVSGIGALDNTVCLV